MRWLEHIFRVKGASGGNDQKDQGFVKLKFDSVDGWIKAQTADFFDIVNSSIISSYQQLASLKEHVELSRVALEKAVSENEENVNFRMKKVVLDHRASLTKKLYAFVRDVKIPQDAQIKVALLFYSTLTRQINQLMDRSARNIYFVNMLFREQVESITKTIKAMIDVTVEAKKVLESKADKIADIEASQDRIRKVHALLLSDHKIKEKTGMGRARLDELAEQKKALSASLSSLKESQAWQNLFQQRSELKEIKVKLNRKEEEVYQIFSNLRKVFIRFAHYASELNKPEREILKLYIDSPPQAMAADSGLNVLNKILTLTQQLILSDKIALGKKQRAKMISEVHQIQTTDILNALLRQRAELKNQLEELENLIDKSEIAGKIAGFEKKLATTEDEIGCAREQISQLEKDAAIASQSIPSELGELAQQLTSLFGKRIEVTII